MMMLMMIDDDDNNRDYNNDDNDDYHQHLSSHVPHLMYIDAKAILSVSSIHPLFEGSRPIFTSSKL
jgi:hypothetical protein